MFYFNNNIKNNAKKKVNFQNIIRVIYIPKYKDICDCKDIWWSEIDKRTAMIFMNNEINTLIRMHPSMNTKQAMKLLYQPNNIRYYDPTNFV
jgi:hypothetical protein